MTNAKIIQITLKPQTSVYEFKYEYIDKGGVRQVSSVDITEQFVAEHSLINFKVFTMLFLSGILTPLIYKEIDESDGE